MGTASTPDELNVTSDVNGRSLVASAGLVNGATIAQLDVDRVTYWHVERDSYDILLAENGSGGATLLCPCGSRSL